MRIVCLLCFISLMLVLNTGCSLVSDFSDYVFPEGEDDGETPTPTERKPASAVHTVGGGTCASTDYKLTVSIGMPQPMGNATSDDQRIQVGPNSILK